MAKTVIIDVDRQNRVPFLRGVLARSLSGYGLSFTIAHQLASEIRQELEQIDEITSLQLRKMVVKKLEEQGEHKIIARYQAQNGKAPVIYVENLDGQLSPYSYKNYKRLEAIGLDRNQINLVINKMHFQLISSGLKQIHVNHLVYLIHRCLQQDPSIGSKAAKRYLNWVNFSRSSCPLIILIGGTTGCGKSSISTALANRLGIVRTQSTDMLREVMRIMIPKRLLPVLHESSFNAWKTLPAEQGSSGTDPEQMLVAGYRTQAELLSVSCEAVMQRAQKENISLLLEGVHVTPSLLQKVPADGPVVAVHIMLAVLKQKVLKKRIKGRNIEVPSRSSVKHPANFQDIWRLQEYLLDEADQADVAIVENNDKEETLRQIMKIVMNKISKGYSISASELIGEEYASYQSTNIK